MVSCYNLIGRNVFGLISGQILGIVSNVVFTSGKLDRICIASDEEEFEISAADVLEFGEFVMLKNEQFLPAENRHRVLGSVVLSQSGKSLGVLDDIIINANMRIYKFCVFNNATVNEIDYKNVFSMDNGVINLKGAKKIIKKAAPKQVVKSIQIKEETYAEAAPKTEPIAIQTEPQNQQTSTMPNRLVTGYYFLLGRTVTQSIFSREGLIIRQGEKVDAKMLMFAFRENRLAELTSKAK